MVDSDSPLDENIGKYGVRFAALFCNSSAYQWNGKVVPSGNISYLYQSLYMWTRPVDGICLGSSWALQHLWGPQSLLKCQPVLSWWWHY
ncbi:hypothetical protein ACSBR2_025849 [Camellia fascicularis]